MPNEDIFFNRHVLIDIMYLDSKSVLHIVDKDNMFSAASFLSHDERTQHVWRADLKACKTPYLGYSKAIDTDQGRQFLSELWNSLLLMARIEVKTSGVQSPNALRSGERYHS